MKYPVLLVLKLVLFVSVVILPACAGGSDVGPVSFSELISQPEKYNGKNVALEAFYFSGFEISVICESLGPSTYGAGRMVPAGELIWVKPGMPSEVSSRLYVQTDTPSGYAEHFGKVRVTGDFKTGARYGHMDAYSHQITVKSAESVDWSPPPVQQ